MRISGDERGVGLGLRVIVRRRVVLSSPLSRMIRFRYIRRLEERRAPHTPAVEIVLQCAPKVALRA